MKGVMWQEPPSRFGALGSDTSQFAPPPQVGWVVGIGRELPKHLAHEPLLPLTYKSVQPNRSDLNPTDL
jgi:hypothetical protein